MSVVTQLTRVERPRIDMDQIEMLYRNLGPYGAEAVIASGLDDVSGKLSLVHIAACTGPTEELHKALRDAALAADQIGLVGLAQTARDAMQCIEDGDPIAEAATLSRLGRLGDGAIGALNAVRTVSG